MKLNKHTFFSTLFLFIFLSAFSAGAYVSLSNSFNQFTHFSKHKELKGHTSTSVSDNSFFEETEDDNEDSVSPFAFVLPDHFNFKAYNLALTFNKQNTTLPLETTVSPLFLSIRSLRI